MSEDKLELPEEYDPDAVPEEPENSTVTEMIRKLRVINAQQEKLEAERKAVMRDVIPLMRKPVPIFDPFTGEPIIATAIARKQVTVDAGELWKELEAELGEAAADPIWHDVLKPREVDTKDNGAFQKAVEDGRIPMHVVAKVAREKVSSAYVSFPKRR